MAGLRSKVSAPLRLTACDTEASLLTSCWKVISLYLTLSYWLFLFSFYLLQFFCLLFSIFSCSIHFIDFISCHFLLSFSDRHIISNALSVIFLIILPTHLLSFVRNDFLFTVYCFLFYLILSMSVIFSHVLYISFFLTLLYFTLHIQLFLFISYISLFLTFSSSLFIF